MRGTRSVIHLPQKLTDQRPQLDPNVTHFLVHGLDIEDFGMEDDSQYSKIKVFSVNVRERTASWTLLNEPRFWSRIQQEEQTNIWEMQLDQNRSFDDRVVLDVPSDAGSSKHEVALISDD